MWPWGRGVPVAPTPDAMSPEQWRRLSAEVSATQQRLQQVAGVAGAAHTQTQQPGQDATANTSKKRKLVPQYCAHLCCAAGSDTHPILQMKGRSKDDIAKHALFPEKGAANLIARQAANGRLIVCKRHLMDPDATPPAGRTGGYQPVHFHQHGLCPMFTDPQKMCTCAPLTASEIQAIGKNASLEPACTCGARVHRRQHTIERNARAARSAEADEASSRAQRSAKKRDATAVADARTAAAAHVEAGNQANAELEEAAAKLSDTNALLLKAEKDIDQLLALRRALALQHGAQVEGVAAKGCAAAEAVADRVSQCAAVASGDIVHELNLAARRDVELAADQAAAELRDAGARATEAARAAKEGAEAALRNKEKGRSVLMQELAQAEALLERHGNLQEAVRLQVDAEVKELRSTMVEPVTLTYLLDTKTSAAHVQYFTGTDRTGLLMLLCTMAQTRSALEMFQKGIGSKALTEGQQLLTALFKLSRNLPHHMISRTLGTPASVATTTLSRCFIKVVLTLTEHIKRSWGRSWSEDMVNEDRLEEYSGNFSLVHLIADCSSTSMEGTRSHLQKMFTFSPCHGTTVIKWALALNCAGVIEWVSAGHCGNSNEAFMCADHNNPMGASLIDAILPRYTLMYDKGGGQLCSLCAQAQRGFMCPCHKREGKMSAFELNRSELMSSRRSHVERAVKKMKRRLILSGLPLARSLFVVADEILHLCCFLSHLDGPLPFAGNTMLDEDGYLDDAFTGLDDDADELWEAVAEAVEEAEGLDLAEGASTEQTVPGEAL